MPFGKAQPAAKPAGKPAPTPAKPAPAKPAGAAAAAPAASQKAVLDALAAIDAKLTALSTGIKSDFKTLFEKLAKPAAPAGAAGKPAGGATPPAAKPAGSAAKPGSATGASATPKAPTPKPATAPTAPATGDGEIPSLEDLKTMSRKQLSDVARACGVDPAGQKAEDIVKMLDAKRGEVGGATEDGGEAPADDGPTQEMITILSKVIEDNYETLAPFLEGEYDAENGVLGCNGDCGRCPNPEGHESPAHQIAACFTALHEHLGLEVPAVG